MPLTLADLKAYVVHYAGGGDPNPVLTNADTTKQNIVNQAGRYLFNMHSWSWKESTDAQVDWVASQSYASLPSDVEEVTSLIERADSLSGRLIRATLDFVVDQRERSGVSGLSSRYWAVSYPGQTSTTVYAGNPRIELSWTPGSNLSNAARVVYKRKWLELTADAAVANIPIEFEWLLVSLINAFAVQHEHDQFTLAIDSLLSSPSLAMLKGVDGLKGGFMLQPIGSWIYDDMVTTRPYDEFLGVI